jgi:hypothetical protein
LSTTVVIINVTTDVVKGFYDGKMGKVSARPWPKVVGANCDRLGRVLKKSMPSSDEHRMVESLAGKPQRRPDVLQIEVGQFFHDLLGHEATREQIQDVTDTDPETSNARTTAALLRVHRNPIGKVGHRAHYTEESSVFERNVSDKEQTSEVLLQGRAARRLHVPGVALHVKLRKAK